MGQRGQDKGEENDKNGLIWLHKFRWLRARELADLMWPRSTSKLKNAEHLLRKWKDSDNNYVITRKLPNGAGSAYVLSVKGAQFLKNIGISSAISGKDWGETKDTKWIPPKDWKHALMAHGYLASMIKFGFEVYPEFTLRRENSELKKIPDGLLVKDQEGNRHVFWVEVENQRKTGESMEKLAKFLIMACNGKAPTVSKLRATNAIVVYNPDAKDEKGYAINHRGRVANAIMHQSMNDIWLYFAPIQPSTSGYKVENIRTSPECIESLKITCTLDSLDWYDASVENVQSEYISERYTVTNHFLLQYYKLRHPQSKNTWLWEFSRKIYKKGNGYDDEWDPETLQYGTEENEANCKRALVAILLKKVAEMKQE